MKRNLWLALGLLALVSIIGCTPITAPAATSDQLPPLRFAVTDLQGLEELQRDFGPFQATLAQVLEREVDLFPVTDRTAAAVALQGDQVDFVLTGPAEYVVIRARTNAVPVVAIERPDYKSVIVVHGDSGISTVADLKGKKIAMTDIGSTSGHLGPSQLLVDNGIDPMTDLEIVMAGGAIYEAFLNRDVDAAGINLLNYQRVLRENNLTEADMPLLVEGPLFPPDIFVANANLPAELIDEIREKMLANEDALVQAILGGEGNAKYDGGGMVAVTDEDYDIVRDMYRAVGVDDFSEFIGE
jgi:phosphonate transport system substrate-binding protein